MCECLSCDFIEDRIIFDFEQIFICNCPQGEVQASNAVCKFSGGDIPLDMIMQKKERLRWENNYNLDNSACKGCPQLKKKDWGASVKQNFGMVIINNFAYCNLACKYCYTVTRKDLKLNKFYYPVKPLIEEMINNKSLRQDAHIAWAGGEPTILGEFEETSSLILSAGYLQTVNTSGVKFSEAIERGLHRNRTFVNISLDSGTPETYLRIKGKDYFYQVLDNINKYASTSGSLCVKYIVMSDNNSDIDVLEFVKLCGKNNVRAISIAPETSEVMNKTISEDTLLSVAKIATAAARSNLACEIQYDNFTPMYAEVIKANIAALEGSEHKKSGLAKILSKMFR